MAALAPVAHGAERVTLHNGFQIRCDHHALTDGRTRLYLNAGEDNYIELRPDEIAAVETVPNPPAPTGTPGSSATPDFTRNAKLSAADLAEMLSKAGEAHHLDADLLASLVKAESGGNARAVSPAGARGLMQLMPATARDLGVADSFQPDQNVQGGSAYLDALLTRYNNNLALALAAYNAGPEAVERYHGIPPYHETQAYVARVIHEFNRRVRAREAVAKRISAQAGVSPAEQR